MAKIYQGMLFADGACNWKRFDNLLFFEYSYVWIKGDGWRENISIYTAEEVPALCCLGISWPLWSASCVNQGDGDSLGQIGPIRQAACVRWAIRGLTASSTTTWDDILLTSTQWLQTIPLLISTALNHHCCCDSLDLIIVQRQLCRDVCLSGSRGIAHSYTSIGNTSVCWLRCSSIQIIFEVITHSCTMSNMTNIKEVLEEVK